MNFQFPNFLEASQLFTSSPVFGSAALKAISETRNQFLIYNTIESPLDFTPSRFRPFSLFRPLLLLTEIYLYINLDLVSVCQSVCPQTPPRRLGVAG